MEKEAKEQLEAVKAKAAFEQAVKAGRLTDNPEDANYAGKYMFMGTISGKDTFKNINTRTYDV